MANKPLLQNITLTRFLSYGAEPTSVDLLPLNVFIGPNGSGKSNFLEALSLLRASATDLAAAIRGGGGFEEYRWKRSGPDEPVYLGVTVGQPAEKPPLRLTLALIGKESRVSIFGEILEVVTASGDVPLYDRHMEKALYKRTAAQPGAMYDSLRIDQSIIAQLRDPESHPELTFLYDVFRNISLYHELNVARKSPVRLPQPTDLPADILLPDGSNLGLVLHGATMTARNRRNLLIHLKTFYPRTENLSSQIYGSTIQPFLEEVDGSVVPPTRMSDGTLRFLCLLAILCNPDPPPVIAIEEPELGLHPDIMPTVAELLLSASERSQVFVTTHSDALVGALTHKPETVLVCERSDDSTTLRRLDSEELASWLEKYTLDELWRMGEIGGNSL
ncbi:MAG TPA: AAA family ATPase [Longimicrobium sp.]|jgi:predicted ATPase|uniref:AAA family ATPase n=1 Tax=Longimicrobium sp. TaxID=2029185 RepID=UPI002ED9CE40